MKSLHSQIANKCKHFTGLGNKECSIGIKYKDVEVPGARPIKIPCVINSSLSGGNCSKSCFKTKEEVEKELQKIKNDGVMVLTAYATIKTIIKETDNPIGKIECPSCKGDLNYNASSTNGHIWAKCKCGLGWVE